MEMSLPWTRVGDTRAAVSPPAVQGNCRQMRQRTLVQAGYGKEGFVSKRLLGEMGTLGVMFLLGLAGALRSGPSARAFKELTCFGIRRRIDN